MTGLNPPKDGMGTWSEKFLFFHFFFQTLALCFAFWCDMISPHGLHLAKRGEREGGILHFANCLPIIFYIFIAIFSKLLKAPSCVIFSLFFSLTLLSVVWRLKHHQGKGSSACLCSRQRDTRLPA